eukprot:GCRY01004052.1.p1 GENE.GCRY01004052.1~~GCRY01004052.1.p1  ORF type:complete len:500 (-),score=134.05 GCRY01004052.1:72-1571(-)
MALLIKNGIVVNHNKEERADVLIENGKIAKVGLNLVPKAEENTLKIVDAEGCYVMPGGIDPHTHFQLPVGSIVSVDDAFIASRAALCGGTTSVIDFANPVPGESLLVAYEKWMDWISHSCCDWGLHVSVTWFGDQVAEEMGVLARERGVQSFKHFLAYKGAMMLDDEAFSRSLTRCRELGCLPTVHAENGEMVALGTKKMLGLGITGPEGHPQSRPVLCEVEAVSRGIAFAEFLNTPLYVVHTSTAPAARLIAAARERAVPVYGEVTPQHLVVDDSVYFDASKDWEYKAAMILSPPFRPVENIEGLWNVLEHNGLQTSGSDHAAFSHAQKRERGKDDFSKIPNGVGSLEERMVILFDRGVRTGRLTPSAYVALTSYNTARIFNLTSKGAIAPGYDADVVVINPKAHRTISQQTQKCAVDFNVFEGITVHGVPVTTILRGDIVWQVGVGADGAVDYQSGVFSGKESAGRYLHRPTHGYVYEEAQLPSQKAPIQSKSTLSA